MPKVLITGSSGLVGRAITRLLVASGWMVARLDLTDGHDLRNAAQVRAAAQGCDAIVHAGAIARTSEVDVEYGAFVHVDDVADAVQRALVADLDGHIRMIVGGPGAFDASLARRTLGWDPRRGWRD